MDENFNYKYSRMKVMDFTASVERLANIIDILRVYHEYCPAEYADIWRFDELINTLMKEAGAVMDDTEEIRKIFS